jgi:peroxiredoxin Q/BCP
MMAEMETGKSAPLFTLKNQAGENVALKDLRGRWVVLYFYPKDDTPGCTTQACEFTSALAEFEGLNATVLGVSPDTPEDHRAFIAKHQLNITLLSDPQHKVMEKYEAWGTKILYGKETVGVIRSTVLIDPKGKLAQHWKNVRAVGHAAKVQAALSKLAGTA